MPSKDRVLIGYFNSAGHPAIKAGVYGIHPDLKQEFELMIDTGFTGFLLMPIMSAFPLGLTVSVKGVFLVDEDMVEQFLTAFEKRQSTAGPSPTPQPTPPNSN